MEREERKDPIHKEPLKMCIEFDNFGLRWVLIHVFYVALKNRKS